MSQPHACPDPKTLQSLLLGRLPGPQIDALARHIEECEACSATARTLCANDTLVEAARSRASEAGSSELLCELVQRLTKAGTPDLDDTFPPTRVSLSGPILSQTSTFYPFLAPPIDPSEIGRLGDYRILSVLGQGGMGVVFHAEDVRLGRSVALKVIRPESADRAGARERFFREARLAASLEHDNVVTVFQVGDDAGVPYLAMQLLAGESLETAVRRGGLDVGWVLSVGTAEQPK